MFVGGALISVFSPQNLKSAMRNLIISIPYFFLFISSVFVGCTSTTEVNTKPNLLLIISDEHNFRTLACYRDLLPPEQAKMWGETVVETPNIDWLAKNGAIFTSMYASSPLCSPSRSSMFTGQYPHRVNMQKNNLVMDSSFPTIADVLGNHGYKTGYAGKWHLSGEAKPGWQPTPSYGFQDNRYMYNRGHWKKMGLKAGEEPFVAVLNQNGEPTSNVAGADEKSFTSDWLTQRTINFIHENKSNPFFYVLSIPDPHTPNTVRAPYDTLYSSVKFEMPKTFYIKQEKDAPQWRKRDGKTRKMQNMLAQYYGMVRCIDDNVGRVVANLKKERLLENTIVVFSSDHGDMLGEHKRINKDVPYEASARIPFVVYYPKSIKPGTVVAQAANTTDWMATLLSMLHIQETPETAGRDLTPLLHKVPENWDDITFSRLNNWVAAFTDRYKLVLEIGNHPWLIDLQKDPDELINYYSDPAYKKEVKYLATKLLQYGQTQNDPIVLNDEITAQLQMAGN